MDKVCLNCGRVFEGRSNSLYCSPRCGQEYRRKKKEKIIDKSLCKNCKKCEILTYERKMHGGVVLKFKYCKEIKDIVDMADWSFEIINGKLM